MRVKIKSWEAMEEEFGINEYGSIACDYEFTEDMEENMPDDRIMEIFYDRNEHRILKTENDWHWLSEDMIEAYLD